MDLTQGQNLNIFNNDRNILLVSSDDLPQMDIYCGPRIGLSTKYPAYQNRHYRFGINKDKIKKKKSTLVVAQNN